MPHFGFDIELLVTDISYMLLAFLLAFPIGWERGRGARSAGFRTLPVVALASCGFALLIGMEAEGNVEARARVMQGVISGIGFIGGGAILKGDVSVKGLVTAASIWNAGAIGLAVGFERANIAVTLSAINLLSLVLLGRLDDNGEGEQDAPWEQPQKAPRDRPQEDSRSP